VRASAGLTAEQAVEIDSELRIALKELGSDNAYPPIGIEGDDSADAVAAVDVD
jgi:hypothetical protein